MALDDRASKLIEAFYAGAHDRPAWDMAIDSLCDRLGARWAMVGVFDERARAPMEPSWHRARNSRFWDGVAEYHSTTAQLDPTNHFAARQPKGGVFDSFAQIGGENYFDHAFVSWLRPNFGSAFWRLHYGGRDGLQLGVALHTDADIGPMAADRAREFAMYYEHIRAAAWLAARAPAPDGPDPVLLLDARGELLSASDTAHKLIARGDALALIGRRPRALCRRSSPALDKAIASALSAWREGGAGGSAVLERRDGTPLFATVTPLPREHAPLAQLRPAAMIRLVDPAAPPHLARFDWRALFGFTPAEARLARALIAGDGNLRDTADTLGIAYATARVQLASLFDKAGVRSQVQLVRLLTRLG